MSCPKCSSTSSKVLETKRCVNGTKRRRVQCLNCEQRWTTWDGPRPTTEDVVKRRKPQTTRNKRAPLSDEQVRFALVRTDLNNAQVARELGCLDETVRQIRAGLVYRFVFPDLMRPGGTRERPLNTGPSCDKCSNWNETVCGFGFPDPMVEGLAFAVDCELYSEAA